MIRKLKVALALMVAFTVVYACAAAYACSSGEANHFPLYQALRYRSDTPPCVWHTPQQLGIVGFCGEGGDTIISIEVDPSREPFDLRVETPIFLYDGVFYQVSPLDLFYVPPHRINYYAAAFGVFGGTLGAGWVLTGTLFIKRRGKE
jgi:hypothetical protein